MMHLEGISFRVALSNILICFRVDMTTPSRQMRLRCTSNTRIFRLLHHMKMSFTKVTALQLIYQMSKW